MTARLNNFGGLGASVETYTSATESTASGLAGQYSVKMDLNGFVSGFGLQSSLIAGGAATSTFLVSVDKFAVATPASSITNWSGGASIGINEIRGVAGNTDKVLVCKTPGTTSGSTPAIAGAIGSTLQDGGVTWQIASRVPFAVLTVPTTINGVSVPGGVYIDAAYVLNGTIKKSQLGDAIIDDAKVIDLSASKLLTGSLAVGADISSSGFSTGVSGWRIQGNGNAEFQSGTFRGTIFATAGQIGGNTIDSTGIQSPGYSSGSSGWRISSLGFAEFSGVTIRGSSTFSGTLNVNSGGSDRMEITGTRIKIFSGGQERVRIGDLSG